MTQHLYFWTVIVPLLVSVLVSLFAQELRRWFRSLLRGGGRSLNRGVVSDFENKLAVINWVHGNAYNLLLWLLLEARILIFNTVGFFVLGILLQSYFGYAKVIASTCIVGAWVGRTIRVSELLGNLQNYDKAKAELEGKIEWFKSRDSSKKS